MTWLPVDADGRNERDATLGLHDLAYGLHRTFLSACDAAVEPHLLEVCRARMAQLLRCREELALYEPAWLERLRSWYDEPSFDDTDRCALAFVEQFILDPSLVTREMTQPLEEWLGTTGLIDFTTVISAYEASLRLSAFLDLEPAP